MEQIFLSHKGEVAALLTAVCWTFTSLAFESAGKRVGALSLNLIRLAMGYEFKHFYLGATGSTILRSFQYGNYMVDLGTEQFRVMIGKRFNVGRK